MRLDTRTLRRASAALFGFLESEFGLSIVVSRAYYWEIPGWSRLDVSSPARDLGMGDVTDDWEELRPVADDPDTLHYVSVERLANVFLMIANEGMGEVPRCDRLLSEEDSPQGRPMGIELPVLQRAATMLLGFLEDEKGLSFHLSYNHYWEIPGRFRLDVGSQPTDHARVRQVSHDWEKLKRMLEETAHPDHADLECLAYVLYLVSEEGVHEVPRDES